jgi:hypothetical protein
MVMLDETDRHEFAPQASSKYIDRQGANHQTPLQPELR